jgi:dTDP-4-dehydrorhamnose reductase
MSQGLELWGGIECTINRVGDRWFSQLERNGHLRRRDDLERIAELGIRTLRYPLLWELAAAPGDPSIWSCHAERLATLQRLGVTPIAGLLHHGSGPAFTHLADPEFPEHMARYARECAERFPALTHYTPINEPLTTARFSGLYGHWYPHARDGATFARILMNQVKGIILAMQAIRRVRPDARLVQTDDLGTTYSTPHMRYQCDFENERRWLAWDLLCGRVNAEHPLWGYLMHCSVGPGELSWCRDNACMPDLVGINHYVTSDRYLDERLERHDRAAHGGNELERYADCAAVRVVQQPYSGWNVLAVAAKRYGLPVALTEVHLGCTREEQLRWLCAAWDAAVDARSRGVDVRAVTVWSLLGSFDWQCLLTRATGHYEAGPFDVRGSTPRATALAHLVETLAKSRTSRHPVTQSPGWWERHPPQADCDAPASAPRLVSAKRVQRARPILICGAQGSLGRALVQACVARGLAFHPTTRRTLDIIDGAAVDHLLHDVRPWAVVNAAGYVRVDDAETDSQRCYRENTAGPAILARAADAHGIPFLTYSSDLVFDGKTLTSYLESDRVAPLGVYGRSKVAAEELVLGSPGTLCIRTAAFFGVAGGGDFLSHALRTLAAGRPFEASSRHVVSPTYVPELADASLDLLLDGCHGLWHLTNLGAVSWHEFARLGAAAAGISTAALREAGDAPAGRVASGARRPAFSALGSRHGPLLSSLESAVGRFVATIQVGAPMANGAAA